MVCELGAPTVTFPKLTLAGLTAIAGCPWAMPLPLKGTTTLEVDELLVIVRLPERFPVVVGSILATKFVAWPAVRLIGNVTPVIEKLEPATAIFEMVNVPEPEFVIDIACPTLWPTSTPPKLTLVGLTVIAGCPCEDMPAPLSGMTTLGVEELFENVMLPAMVPAFIVSMLATTVVACPAAKVIGPETPDTEKPAPATEMFEIVSTPEPKFVIDICWPTFCPRPTPPKLTDVGWMEIIGCPELVPVPDNMIVETAGFVFAVIEMLPVTAPVVVGANLAINDVP